MERDEIVVPDRIERAILRIRGENVLLDSDLAELYGVETRTLVQAVKRNLDRFPADFMFQLTDKELDLLRSQSVISRSWGGRRYPPYAFTEQGIAMLSSVLRSKKAILVNIEIMRAFIKLRRVLATQEKLTERINELEKKYDHRFSEVFEVIKKLISIEDNRKKRLIGFGRNNADK